MAQLSSYEYLGPVSAGNLDGIRAVAAAGVDVNSSMSTDSKKHDYSPLTLAIENEDLDSVKTLLDVGADPNTVDPMGRTPLSAALMTVSLKTVDTVEAICLALIEAGAVVTHDAREDAHDSFTGTGEPMFSDTFLARLDELGPASATTTEDSE